MFYLKHYFDPSTQARKLTPQTRLDGSVNHAELNFIQSKEKGDVIAEWVEVTPKQMDSLNSQFLSDTPTFSAGRGTGTHSEYPLRLFAAVDGQPCYNDEKQIIVEKDVTIASDIDYNTGNIEFPGNVEVEGGVRSSFSVQARNVTVQGTVEGATIRALRDLNCPGGVKGAGEAFLEAGKIARIAFCENATIKAGSDVLVKGASMHTNIYAGNRLAVGNRLTGGNIACYEYLYVGGQLGGGLDTVTSIILGFQPTLLYADEESSEQIATLHKRIKSLTLKIKTNPESKAEVEPVLTELQSKLAAAKNFKAILWNGIVSTKRLDKCKILVPGKVHPGVEISIGDAYLKVEDYLEDVYFYYEDYEVKIGNSTQKTQS